jgi:hypothetical protein
MVTIGSSVADICTECYAFLKQEADDNQSITKAMEATNAESDS